MEEINKNELIKEEKTLWEKIYSSSNIEPGDLEAFNRIKDIKKELGEVLHF